ncbi:SHOCT domain-containing protein [Snodgrassella sp.]|uniref:SHOCT domain-containing protein n=1 Tax=Snodgrassella sp. TaxID=2815304 RepID=UPI002582BCC5|nr:SHOCT domain-containing protein [Snodgrassella sp.]MCO6525296.1 DUF1311 domain-containing protein [Snodgrassella sp.]
MSKPSLTNELTRLYELLEKGAITQEEYEEHKALLLNQARGASSQNDGYSSSPAQAKPAGEVPQIIINQSSSVAASASATAVAKNGGCLKSVLAAIGFLVVIGAILKACSSDEKTVSSTPASEPAAQIVANAVNQEAAQENMQAALQTAKQENTAVNNEINALWTDMDADVRNHLKSQQLAWNQQKKRQCQSNQYPTPEQNQIEHLNCETSLTHTRISELEILQNQLYAEVKEAKLQKLRQEANDSLEVLQATWDSIPEPIKDQLSTNFKNWTKSADNECDSAKPADTQVQTDINRYICRIKLVKAKTKELEGYKI